MKQIKYGKAKQSLKKQSNSKPKHFPRVQILKCRVSTRLSIKGKVTIATPKAGLARWPPLYQLSRSVEEQRWRNLRLVLDFFNRGKKREKKKRKEEALWIVIHL